MIAYGFARERKGFMPATPVPATHLIIEGIEEIVMAWQALPSPFFKKKSLAL